MSPVIFQTGLNAREWDWHPPSLTKEWYLFWKAGWPIFAASIYNCNFYAPNRICSHNLFNSGTYSLARGQIIDSDLPFLFNSGCLPTQDTGLCPTFGVPACRDSLFLRWLTEKPTTRRPKGCFQIWSPKGNPLNSSRHAFMPTHFHSLVCSNTWLLLCLCKPQEGRKGGGLKSSCYPFYTRNHFLHPFSSFSPSSSKLSLSVKGERHLFQMPCRADNKPVWIQS